MTEKEDIKLSNVDITYNDINQLTKIIIDGKEIESAKSVSVNFDGELTIPTVTLTLFADNISIKAIKDN